MDLPSSLLNARVGPPLKFGWLITVLETAAVPLAVAACGT